MIELTVKTLDSKNHQFSVPDDVTVKQLKEHIADSVNIPADSQRLIYCGRVLQDDKNLSEYDVNGKVIHLVQRAPPVNNGSGPDSGPNGARSTTNSTTGTRRNHQWRTLFGPPGNTGNAMYLGAMAFPAEIMDATAISMQQPRQCLSSSRLAVVRNMLRRATIILNRLENPPQESTDTSPENGSGSQDTNTEEDTLPTITPIAAVEITPGGSFIINNHQVDVGGSNVEITTEAVNAPGQNASTAAESGAQSAATTNEQEPTAQNGNEEEGGNGASSRYPRTRVLAELLDQVAEINTRVQPFQAQYQQLMRDDPPFSDQAAVATNQRLFTSVSEIMHNLAHAYHALSDIMCDFSQQPPRFLRCRPVLIHHSAVVQTGIPIQVSTSLGPSNSSQPDTSTSNTRPTGNGTRSAASTAASSSASGEPPSTQEPATPRTTASTASDNVGPTQPATAAAAAATATTTASAEDPANRCPRSPSVSPPRAARFGGNGGPGFEFFVDVAPGSITIDSVEATLVTNTPPNTSEPTNWQNPPEFVQNLITALAGQFMGATLQQYRFPDQQNGSNAGNNGQQASTATTSQQTSNSPPQPSAATQNSQARGNTATHPTTATQTRSTARPHVHLSPSLHGLRNNNFDPFLPCNSHHIRSSRGRQAAAQAQPNTGSNTSTDAAPRVVSIPSPSSISISLRAEPLINAEQSSSVNSGSQQTPPPNLPPELQALFQTLHTVSGGQNPATLAQLLQNVPGYSYTPGESILTDIFMTLAQSLSFLDMVQLSLGNSECLIRARPQLRQLISQRLLNNEPLTISAITQIIDRFNSELQPYYSIFDNARLREEVDLPATINLYNHSMLPSILNTLMEEDQSTFHRTLMRKCILYVRQFCALLQYCCLDGTTGLESILRTFVSQMTLGVPRVLQEWNMSHSIVNFRIFVNSLNVPSEDIKRFLVYRTPHPVTSPQPATTPSTPAVPATAEPMDTQEIEELESLPRLIREPPIADVPPTQDMNEMVGWQNTLPSEWVPIITRDSQRQRRQNPQGPFSDAYLSGMPSKRRKLITSAKPQGNLSQVITESMATALGAAGMSSGPEVDVVAQRAGHDGTLRAAYREQVRNTLCHKLSSNPDYLPEKYPNTAKYFKK